MSGQIKINEPRVDEAEQAQFVAVSPLPVQQKQHNFGHVSTAELPGFDQAAQSDSLQLW